MKIGCCDAFKKCSDAGECIRIGTPNYEEFFKECYYADNLAKGLNFYTEYNDNNQRKADEYKRKLEIESNENLKEPLLEIEKDVTSSDDIDIKFKNKYMNGYLVIDDRQYFVGTRSGYYDLTYNLGSSGIDKLIEDLKDVEIYIETECYEDKYFEELGTNDDRANWRIVVTISDTNYNISNSDTRLLRKNTAIMVAEHLSSFGFKATCECIGNSKLNFTIGGADVKKKPEKTKFVKATTKDVSPAANQQISLFEL